MTDQHPDLHLDLPGARLAYDVTGTEGRAVVVAHGLTASRAADAAHGALDRSALAAALPGRRLVRYDARGHGASTGEPDPASYTWPALAEDLLALLDAVSPGEPVDAVGASMGTAAVLWAATRRPERFRRLVLTIPPTAWETRAPHTAGYEAAAQAIERHGLAPWLRAVAAEPPVPVLAAGGWPSDGEPAVPEHLLPSAMRGAVLSDLPDPDALAALPHPTLLLPWATDPGHPVSTAERLAELLPAATLEVAETPEAIRGWDARIARFLAG